MLDSNAQLFLLFLIVLLLVGCRADCKCHQKPEPEKKLRSVHWVEVQCSDCKGTGKVHCPLCDGTKIIKNLDPDHNGKPCHMCGKEGELYDCGICGGCGKMMQEVYDDEKE